MHNHHSAQQPSAEIYERILSCENSAGVADAILSPVADMLDARSAVFLQISASSFGGRHFGAHDYVGDAPRSIEVYLEDGLYDRDPVMQPAIQWLRSGGKDTAPAILTGSVDANLDRDRVYRDNFLRPYDIGHVVAIAVPVKTGMDTQLGCIGFHRRHSDKGFRSEQISRFQRLGPALRSALYGIACREAMQVSEAITLAARESGCDMGYLVLDEDLVVRNGNARAMEDLGLIGGPADRSPLLGEIKQRLLEGGLEGKEQLCMTATDPGPVDIHIRNFRSVGGDPYYLIATASAGPNRSIGDACRRFGLTDRETEIAIQVAAGQCNASLAKALGISLRTAENHLRAIYRKAEVTSRTQLISRLLQIQ